MTSDAYEPVNGAWPAELPPITRVEAGRAANKLTVHFAGRFKVSRRYLRAQPRRCWIAQTPPFGSIDRGWRRLVHDVSHIVFQATRLNVRSHGGAHAKLEAQMIAYVLAQGWLTGRLKPASKPKATLDDRRAQRLQHAEAMLAEWQHRLKVAQGRVKKWSQRAREARRTP